ncbi:MAG: hypothetical protein ACT4OE_08830 [Sphingosinicella sp.]
MLGNQPARQVGRVFDHIRGQGFHVLDREPTMAERLEHPRIATVTAEAGYPAERTSLDHPLAAAVHRSLGRAGRLVTLPSLGGSLPLYLIRQELGAATVTVGLWNHDNNQHAEDENIRLFNLWNGIAAIAAILAME